MRLIVGVIRQSNLQISIHAPTRGATYQGVCLTAVKSVSIHAPTRGATHELQSQTFHRLVSIHAPTRGATQIFAESAHGYGFQSTHPHGVRLTWQAILQEARKFQSTHPHGVRLRSSEIARQLTQVSIHAPTRGATNEAACSLRGSGVSIHAPTRGATHAREQRFCPARSFNPRTHTGCDGSEMVVINDNGEFQSTHPHGVRRIQPLHQPCVSQVSIHAPTRGAT